MYRIPNRIRYHHHPTTNGPHHDQTNNMDLRLVPRPIHPHPSVAKILHTILQAKGDYIDG